MNKSKKSEIEKRIRERNSVAFLLPILIVVLNTYLHKPISYTFIMGCLGLVSVFIVLCVYDLNLKRKALKKEKLTKNNN